MCVYWLLVDFAKSVENCNYSLIPLNKHITVTLGDMIIQITLYFFQVLYVL